MNRRWVGGLCLASAAAIWGGMYVVSKHVLAYVPPMTLVVMRFVIAAVVLGLVLWLSKSQQKVPRLQGKQVMLYGLIGYTLSIGAQFIGTKLSSAHMGAVITSASPAFIVLFAAWLLKERIRLGKLLSLLGATAGVLVLIGTDAGMEAGSSVLTGNLFLVLAAVTWALYSVMGKRLTTTYPALTISFWATVAGVVFTLPIAGWEVAVEGFTWPTDPLLWLGIIYLGVVSTAVAFFLWTKGFELMDAGTAGLYFFVQPIFGSLLGWLLLDEHLTFSFLLGSLLIFASVAFSMWSESRPAPFTDAEYEKKTC